MSVYVDNMKAGFRRMVMCHMLADTTQELVAMADKIGVARKWIQKPGTSYEHFDICLAKRAQAVAAGAKEVTQKDIGFMLLKRKDKNYFPHMMQCGSCGRFIEANSTSCPLCLATDFEN